MTDGELNILATGPNLAVSVSEELLAGMDEWNTTHHHESGLVDYRTVTAVPATVVPIVQVDEPASLVKLTSIPAMLPATVVTSAVEDDIVTPDQVPETETYQSYLDQL